MRREIRSSRQVFTTIAMATTSNRNRSSHDHDVANERAILDGAAVVAVQVDEQDPSYL